jgi:CheY-like chemotaxis protein
MRVLVVDDERDVLESTADWLRAVGHEVATCGRAAEALASMRAHRPAVVLHDVRMPGLDLAAQMRAIRADPDVGRTPVILFTATLEARGLAEEVGADDGIEKPFEPDAMQALLAKWEARGPR